MSNTTNYGWAYVHPTLGIGLTRGPENSITFQNSPTADIDTNGMGQASGSANLTFNSDTDILTLAGSANFTENDSTNAPLRIKQTGTGDIFQAFDNTTEVFTILDGGNVGINKANPGYKLEVNGDGYFQSDLTVNGNLTVNGTNTIVNSTTIELDDKNIILAKGMGNDAAVNGGGITLSSSAGNKTIVYNNSNSSWKFSEHVELADGKHVLTDAVKSIPSDSNGLTLEATSGAVNIKASSSNQDIIFTVKDGTAAEFQALRIDASEKGNALFTPRDGGFLKVDDADENGFVKVQTNSISIERNNDADDEPYIYFRRSRGSTSEPTKTQLGDDLGTLLFYGYDMGTERSGDFQGFGEAAAIKVIADADHGTTSGVDDTTDTPGRIEFYTTAEGADEVSRRMTIKSDGKVGIGTASPTAELEVNGTVKATAVTVGSAELSEAELEILDGATVTTAELNILDGVTATTSELNILDGVTATTSELNILDGATVTTTELNVIDGDTAATSTTLADADRVVVNDNGTMKQVALTDFETYFEDALDTLPNVTSVGTLTSLTVDNITIDTNDITADTGNLNLKTTADDTDITFTVKEAGSAAFTALTIDGSDNGSAKFTPASNGNLSVSGSGGEVKLSEATVSISKVSTNPFTTNNLNFIRTRPSSGAGSLGTPAGSSESGDVIGHINFIGNDGSGANSTVAKISVVADADFGESSEGAGDDTSDTPGRIEFYTTADGFQIPSQRMVIKSDGKVGIGISSPSTELHVGGTVTAANLAGTVTTAAQPNITSLGNLTGLTVADGNIQLSNGYQLQWGDSETGIFGNATSDYIRLKTAGLDRVAVDSAGNLGIGTITPQRRLHIHQANSALHYGLTIRNNQSGEGLQMGNNADGSSFINNNEANKGGLHLGGAGAAYNDGHIFISGSGAVGIGTTSPDTLLHAVGNSGLTIEETGATGRKLIIEPPTAATVGTIKTHDTGAGLMIKSYNAGDQMFLKDDGNVGIGVTVPNEKLTVEGVMSLKETTSPSATANYGKIYVKASDSMPYFMDDAGVETNLVRNGKFPHRFLNGGATDGTYGTSVAGTTVDILPSDYLISVRTVSTVGAATITVRLPNAVGNAGTSYVIKDIGNNATNQTISVTTQGGDIEQASSYNFESNAAAINVYSDGIKWHIF